MTTHIVIGDIAPRVQYQADGVLSDFAYPFPIFKDADLEVYLGETPQTAGFTVIGAGQSSGGAVSFTTPPVNGVLVTLRRKLSIQRISDFQQSGEFRASVINDELDYQTAALQQVSDEAGRGVKLPPTAPAGINTTLPLPAANAVLMYNATADGFANGPTASAISAAQGHAQSAAASATQAGTSASAASASASGASASASASAASASASATSAQEAAASAMAADVSKIVWRGPWSSVTAYAVSDAVERFGSSYVCLVAHTGIEPPSGATWALMASKGLDGQGSGTVLSVGSGNGLTGGPITANGTLSINLDAMPGLEFNTGALRVKTGVGLVLDAAGTNVDVGTTANKVVQLDATAKLPAVDGSQLTNLPASGAPAGTVYAYAGSTAPSGHLLCDGAAVSRTAYADLFAVLSTAYGVGDGSTTFNVPDLRGRTAIGAGTGSGLTARTLAATGGEESHALTEAELAYHRHSSNAVTGSGGQPGFVYNGSGATYAAQYTSYTGSGNAHNTMPPFLALNFIIKT